MVQKMRHRATSEKIKLTGNQRAARGAPAGVPPMQMYGLQVWHDVKYTHFALAAPPFLLV
jgi:hypothetical protein